MRNKDFTDGFLSFILNKECTSDIENKQDWIDGYNKAKEYFITME